MGNECSKCVAGPKHSKNTEPTISKPPVLRKNDEVTQPQSLVTSMIASSVGSDGLATFSADNQVKVEVLKPADEQFAKENSHKVLVDGLSSRLGSVQSILSQGFPANFPLNESGWTLLHVAAQGGNEGLAQALLRHGANPNIQEHTEMWTPLHVAALNGHGEIVSLLLKSGANRSVVDKLGLTPERLAKQYYMRHIVELLA